MNGRIFTIVDPAREHIDTSFGNTAKRRNDSDLRNLRLLTNSYQGWTLVLLQTSV
jgi:hypothetical protein